MSQDSITPTGYSKEEEYFYKRNQALIEKKRKELDAQREADAKKHGQDAHWMRCPKCGQQMQEVDLAHVKVEQCTGCHGLFLDAGELETLTQSQEPQSFLSGVKRLLG